jgi:hypothetical protein
MKHTISIYYQLLISPNRNDRLLWHILFFLLDYDRAKLLYHMSTVKDEEVVMLFENIIHHRDFEDEIYDITEHSSLRTKQILTRIITRCLLEMKS